MKAKTYIALENIRSLHNIGAIFRTCSFFGIYDVLLIGYTGKDYKGATTVLHKKIKKTSLGAERDLNIQFIEDADSLIEFANTNDLKIVAFEQGEKHKNLSSWENTENKILVFGNELDGVSKKILENSVEKIEISRHGKYHSMNVATCVGIVLFKLTN